MGDAAESLQPLFAALLDAMLALVVGAALLRSACPSMLRANLLFWQRLTVAVLGGAQLLYFCDGAIAMTAAVGTDVPFALWQVLTASHFGTMQALAGFAWLLLMVAVFLMPATSAAIWGRSVFIVGLALLAFARAASGHAMDSGMVSVAVFMQSTHVLAAAAWVGTVAVCAGLALRWRDGTPVERQVLALRASTVATRALVVVVVSGLWNVFHMLSGIGTLRDAWNGTPYLHLLAAKLGCVALAVALGGYNRWRQLPYLHLSERNAASRFALVLCIETLVLGLTVFAAAQLAATMPPA